MEQMGPVFSVPMIPNTMLCNSSGKASKMQQQEDLGWKVMPRGMPASKSPTFALTHQVGDPLHFFGMMHTH